MKQETISLNGNQILGLITTYGELAFDLRHKTKRSLPLKKLNSVLGQNFKNKSEAFSFIHDLFKANNMETLKICDMGDCPEIKSNKIAGRSVGRFLMSWNTPNGKTTNVVELCKVCEEDMRKANAIIEDMS